MRTLTAVSVLSSLSIATIAFSQDPPTRTFSRPQVEFPEPFTDIGAIRELRDGRVIVVDARELTVQLVDFRLASATRIGRTGDGPGEYRWPSKLFPLHGDSSLLQDASNSRYLVIGPDGKPGGFYDPNRAEVDSIASRARRFFVRTSDERGHFYSQAQPIQVGAGGVLELADHAAIERLNVATGKRDTVAMWPMRNDPNARLSPSGFVTTRPRADAFPAWEHWTVAPDGRIAFIFFDPYRVDFVGPNRRVIQNAPIPYDRVRVDEALKQQFKEERQRPSMALMYTRGGGSSMQMMPGRYTEPTEWPEYLPPFLGSAVFAPDGLLWIPRAIAAGKPPLYDIIDRQGKLFQRVQFPPRTKLVGFGLNTVYVVRLDQDDLQYLQRYALPTTARP